MAMHTSKGRYFLTADKSRVVREGDPEAATLYTTAGREVDEAEAERLGLLQLEAEGPEAKAVEAPETENKAQAPPTRRQGG
jgi:hypothetical protein